MKIEFIIDKIEYKKLLSKDIISSDIEYCNKKIKGKSNYLLIMSTQNKSIAAAKLLSKNRIAVEKIFADNNIKYRLLTEEASLFFLQRLYPYACEFETKLRKFIYIALFDINDKARKFIVDKFNSTMRKSGENRIEGGLPQEDFLSLKDLGQIFDFLFSNDEFINETKSQIKQLNTDDKSKRSDRRLTKKELIELIENIEEKTIWNLLFAPNFSDSILPSIYNDIQKYRNDIMHIHIIDYSDYVKIQRLYIKGIKDLNRQLDKGIVIVDTKENVDALANSFGYVKEFLHSSMGLFNPLGANFSNTIKNSISPLVASLSAFQSTINERLNSIIEPLSPIIEPLSHLSTLNSSLLSTLNLIPSSLPKNPLTGNEFTYLDTAYLSQLSSLGSPLPSVSTSFGVNDSVSALSKELSKISETTHKSDKKDDE